MDDAQIRLPNGRVISHCGTRLLAKYLNGPRSLVFDLYAAGQTPEQRKRLCWVDAAVTETMNSNLGCEDWLRLANADVRLDDLDPAWTFESYPAHQDAIIRAYVNVHRALRLQPDSSAQVFKLLALKWPRLIPMIDNVVGATFATVPDRNYTAITESWPVHNDHATPWSKAKKDPALVAVFYLDEFRFALDRVENALEGGLHKLSLWLGAQILRITGIPLDLSPIRILESLIWLEAKDWGASELERDALAEKWRDAGHDSKNSWRGYEIRSYVRNLLAQS